jgi:hypothetical protein
MMFPVFGCLVYLLPCEPEVAEQALRNPVRRSGNCFLQPFIILDEVARVRKLIYFV